MQQKVAENACDFSNIFNVTIGTANFGEQRVPAFDVPFVDVVAKLSLRGSRQVGDVINERVALSLVQVESRRHIICLLRMPGLGMVGDVQANLDRAGGHHEITQPRLLRLPAKPTGRAIFQPSHSAADHSSFRLIFLQSFQHFGRNRINESRPEQGRCVSL